ncbi:LADA_0B02586g1_1 [Lachancea dasiensis]|uniref:Peroxisomal ATPase PEX1 n=1 Tax=Lachancea dasiensis TaxID=1072105 RepID=A0A1G4ISS1_9SACH|nr:LADA_0B02586g1_1 [Lachancea dasiensis]
MNPHAELPFQSLRVSLSDRIRGNFVRLPSYIVQVLEGTSIPVQEFGIAIQKADHTLHVGWDGFESSSAINGQTCVEMNPVLASAHNVSEGDVVDLRIRHFDRHHVATEVYIEPLSSDDWEIIEGNSRFLQEDMLFQTRIVVPDELLICYVEQTVARFKVQKLAPQLDGGGRLTNDTLVVVAPMLNKSRISNEKLKIPVDHYHSSFHQPILMRTLARTSELQGFSMGVCERNAKSTLALVSILKNPLENLPADTPTDSGNVIASAEKVAVKLIQQKHLSSKQAILSVLAWESLGFDPQNGHKINVEFINDLSDVEPPNAIVFRVEQSSSKEKILSGGENSSAIHSDTINSLARLVTGSVLTDRVYLPRFRVYIELAYSSGERVPFYDFRSKGIKFKPADTTVILSRKDQVVPQNALSDPIGIEKMLDDLVQYLTLPIVPSSCSLITGSSGMGKTLLVRHLKSRLELTTSVNVKYVDCEKLIDSSNFTKMKQHLQQLLSACYWYSPSLLILDNAEIIFPQSRSEDEGQSQNTLTDVSTKLCQVLVHDLERLYPKRQGQVRLLLTARAQDKINQSLFSKHAVGKTWKLSAPDRDTRCALLKHLLGERNLHYSEELDESTIAVGTEGYSPRDLLLLADKVLYEHLCDQDSTSNTLKRDSFDRAVAAFTPTSLRGIKIQKSIGIKWSSVGAMHQAKALLLETLEWPIKYGPIFSKCPLRLRSGILLYGYPGCGKTMLASAVAQQCGLNFISVKGPEILNKYIGASEQSVRECFERAQAARPCILFFDEFDSIAPKRGHDSIGVTDRVVNQMLTQMDGAEGLEGVYVLAATSRPDLIDSALLRPGRLDKSVLCGLPVAADRLEILRAIISSGKMPVEPSCNLQEFAEATDGMSGADLQGMCYNAYLSSVHRNMRMSTETNVLDAIDAAGDFPEKRLKYFQATNPSSTSAEAHIFLEKFKHKYTSTPADLGNQSSSGTVSTTSKDLPTITTADFRAACRDTKPSISPGEWQKLSKIYRRFSSDREATMPSGEASSDIGGRLTLM